MYNLLREKEREREREDKRKREREREDKRKREREREDRLDAICKRKIKEKVRVRVKCFRNDCRSDRLFTLHHSGRIPGL